MKAVTQGGNVAEKAQLYNAYQDERLKRFTSKNMKIDSEPMKRPKKRC